MNTILAERVEVVAARTVIFRNTAKKKKNKKINRNKIK